jgi:ABC-type branched-subunit amino acid transport system permease subunit
LVGPVIGAWVIKYFENILSSLNDNILTRFFSFLPDGLDTFLVTIVGKFVGDGWHLTLGMLFVVIVIFLPGGIMEGVRRIAASFRNREVAPRTSSRTQAAE